MSGPRNVEPSGMIVGTPSAARPRWPIAAPRNPAVYAAFRRQLRTGDIALSRADGRPSNRLIVLGTGSPYVHATMIGWTSDVLMLAEARQWRESHLVTLSSQVKRWPGLYDVYRIRRPFHTRPAWARMLRATGTPYGWGQLLRVGLRKLLGPLVPATANDPAVDFPRDCSALVNFACRAGGRVPRPDLPDEAVEPGHFAAPEFARYVCTLYWTDEQAAAVRPPQPPVAQPILTSESQPIPQCEGASDEPTDETQG